VPLDNAKGEKIPEAYGGMGARGEKLSFKAQKKDNQLDGGKRHKNGSGDERAKRPRNGNKAAYYS